MVSENLRADEGTYNNLLRASVRTRQLAKSQELIQMMATAGIRPELRLYNAFVQLLISLKAEQVAVERPEPQEDDLCLENLCMQVPRALVINQDALA